MKSKKDMIKVLRDKRKEAGLVSLRLNVTAENKIKILANIGECELCGSSYFKKCDCINT